MPDPDTAPRVVGRRRNLRLLGAGLVIYGVIGILIFIVVAVAINRPLDRIGELSQSVEEQRSLLVDSMVQGEATIRQMGASVTHMNTSLASARAATERSSQIALSVSGSMFQLRDAMSISFLGSQPLIGLATGFDDTGTQLQQLSSDLTTIGASLAANSTDVVATSSNLDQLADTVATLKDAVQDAPNIGISTEALDTFRLALLAVAGWLLLFALGCVFVGAYLIAVGRRKAEAVVVAG